MTATTMMMYLAVAIFVASYAFIISERFNKTTVALVGAGLMILLPVVDSPDVFYSAETGIDWDVIFLMFGMMMIVSILRQTGVFEYAAIWAAKRANGSPLRIMILLMLVMAAASALLPNVVSATSMPPVSARHGRWTECTSDPSLVSYWHVVGCRRSPGNPASCVARSIGECRMSLWSTLVVSSGCMACR